MKLKRLITLMLICTISTMSLTGCNKQEETSVVESIPNYYEAYGMVAQENATKSAGNLAVYVAQCVINNNLEGFKRAVKLDDSLLKAEDIWNNLLAKNGKISSSSMVYEVDSEGETLIARVAEKTGEYYAKNESGEETGEKLGDLVGDFKEIRFDFEKIGDAYYVKVSDLIDTVPIKIKIPEGSTLKVDNLVIDSSCRDKDGYYVVKGFKKSDPVHIVIDTNIMQGLEFDLPLTEIVGYDSKNNPKYKATDRVFTPICYLDLDTKTNAVAMMKEALQAVMKSIEAKENIKEASCLNYFSKNANLDDIALRWQTGMNAVHNARDYAYSDLILLDVFSYSDKELKEAKATQNTILTNDNAIMTVGMKVSFKRYTKHNDGELSEGTLASLSTAYVPVTFTIEDGAYKIVNIGESFFTGLVKKG